MKTYQFKPLILTLTIVWILGIADPSFAGPKGLASGDLNCEYTFAEDIMNYLETMQPADDIFIYDQHEQLVIKGKADNRIIKNHISQSDLLTEVDHVQYYRLSYDEGIESGYRFANK